MSNAINKSFYIWKYKRRYARKSQNDATINHTIWKTQIWGKVAQWVKTLQTNWKVFGPNPTSPRLVMRL